MLEVVFFDKFAQTSLTLSRRRPLLLEDDVQAMRQVVRRGVDGLCVQSEPAVVEPSSSVGMSTTLADL